MVIGLLMALAGACAGEWAKLPDVLTKHGTLDESGVVRGDTSKKELALIFTGGDFGEGTPRILDTLKAQHINASFFVTGDFLRHEELQPHVKRIVADGHYLGPHSDKHALYCPWEDRKKPLVTEE